MDDSKGMDEYMNIIHHCFDVHLSMAIFRLKGGCNYSELIGQEEQVQLINYVWPSNFGDGSVLISEMGVHISLEIW